MRFLPETFIKAQINSFISSCADFSITFILTEYLGVWYVASSCLGTISGGGCNFLLGKYWVFNYKTTNNSQLIVRYILLWITNLTLNVSMMYILTEYFHVNYMISKVVVAVSFGILVNFHLQKAFVFKTNI